MKAAAVQLGKRVLQGSLAGVERVVRAKQDLSAERLRGMKNFLLLQYPGALGTAIHATPLVAALRAAVPDCRIVVGASGFGLDVFRGNPYVDKLMETASPLVNLRAAIEPLRGVFGGEEYATLLSVGNQRMPVVLQAMMVGASLRVGFSTAPVLMHLPLEFDREMSQIANNLRILRALGHSVEVTEPLIVPSEDDRKIAGKLLGGGGGPMVVMVTQTSVTQRKGWRAERFAAVGRYLRERYGARLVFVGTAGESAAIDSIRQMLDFETLSPAGKTSIGVLGAVMERCAVGVTLDTGSLHIGRGVGLPMVVIAPAWSPEVEWLPVGNPKYRILKNLTMDAPAPADYVIDEVSVEEVCGAVDELMSQRTETESSRA